MQLKFQVFNQIFKIDCKKNSELEFGAYKASQNHICRHFGKSINICGLCVDSKSRNFQVFTSSGTFMIFLEINASCSIRDFTALASPRLAPI